MSAIQHPDYEFEKARLAYTKEYIQFLLEAARQDEANFREHIWEAYQNLNVLDSSLGYSNLLTNVKFLEMTERELHHLQHVQHKPYFARIDFQDRTQEQPEPLYIGKVSLYEKESQKDMIVDWRSPVANVYYDGRLGEVSYEVGDEQIEGIVSLKRQYIIENGELQEIRDIDITTHDELLQEALSGSAQNRLTDIVSTIQEEQNRVIRADLYRPLIVQGVAGSGKTTIALHRIAYFIYKHAMHFSPRSIMILAPSKLFLTYISEVLPELGVDQVQQTTFLDFVKECVDEKLQFTRMQDDLVSLIREECDDEKKKAAELISFKGSLSFAKMVHRYARHIEKSMLPAGDFTIGNIVVMKHERLKQLFLEEYKYLPVYRRIEKLKALLMNYVRTHKKEWEQKVFARYEMKLGKALAIPDDAKRKEIVTRLMEKKDEWTIGFKSECRTAVKKYVKQFPKHDVFHCYDAFLTDEETLQSFMEPSHHHLIERLTQSRLKKKRHYKVEDAAALLYLQHYLYGAKKEVKIKSLIIDEAQDYTLFELYALKKVCKTELFTILGDLSQGIHSYRGVTDWQPVIRHIFPKANYLTLQKSYRTTVEIMNMANAVLDRHTKVRVPLAVPVVRHGSLPVLSMYDHDEELVSCIEQSIASAKEFGLKSFALLGKTKEECEKLAHLLEESNIQAQLMTEQQELNPAVVAIIPIHVAKGLEFDYVGIVSYSETYTNGELDAQLMYVGMTRPLHRLHLYARKPENILLAGAEQTLYTIE